MFDAVNPKQSFADLEVGILEYWKEEDIFRRSVMQRDKKDSFSFYDGPPFATGLPHYGHLLAGTIKDVIPRYQTMKGKRVERRFGWDCHGLPVEYEIEKEYNIKGQHQIEEMGAAKFNALCRSIVQRYTKEWKTTVERSGRFVDMNHDYRTMDPDYMESIWWVFATLYQKGLIYEGHKPMHVCPRCVTPLANFEVTQGYKDVTDQTATAKFELVDELGTYILAWTTTPWTLPGNLFLAIDPAARYYKFQKPDDESWYIAHEYFVRARADEFAHRTEEGADYHKSKQDIFPDWSHPIEGSDLVGKKYKPLFSYFAEKYKKDGFKVVSGDFVTTEDGTGIVHIAPGFGEDDFKVGQEQDVALLQHVTMDGKFVPEVKDFAGMDVKPKDDPSKTDKRIIECLKKNDLLFSSEPFPHSYPHCWRCESPLINYATSSWFVRVEGKGKNKGIKEDMLAANAETEWVPSHLRDGRFGKWLEGARDWAISRNRYWGTPLPIWRSEDGKTIDVIRGRDDLMAHAQIRFTKVSVLRHAQSEGNLGPIYQGTVPGTNLTPEGKKQAEAAGNFFNSPFSILHSPLPSIIYCSPMARTQQTAEAVAKATGAKIVIDERLREIDMGTHEGKIIPMHDLEVSKELRKEKMETRAPQSTYHLPGMETWDEVQKRITGFFEEILPKHRSEHIVVITHGDPIFNVRHFFTKEDPLKITRTDHDDYATPISFFWDHKRNAQMDLHKDVIDDITWPASADGGVMHRIPEVLDCWFESGSMPYAQANYPFAAVSGQPLAVSKKENSSGLSPAANSSPLPSGFPADFIAEGIDQTRGWFYTLTVLSAALFQKSSFFNCVVNGTVLAEDGRKMSKRLKNYPDPTTVIDKYGADAMRFALMNSPAVRSEDLRFSEKVVEETVRSVLLPLWNSYSFFVTYANDAKFEAVAKPSESSHPLDKWIRAEVQDLVNRMTEQLDGYDLSATCSELFETIDVLTNWYIRLSRRRFAGKEEGSDDDDRQNALTTLYEVLITLSQLLAPFCPFITDAIYLNLVPEKHGSIHLTDWPATKKLSKAEETLILKNRVLRQIVRLGNKIRSEKKIKIRQPLAKAVMALPSSLFDVKDLAEEDLQLLKQELNVKELMFVDDPGSLGTAVAMVDARKVGPRLGGRVQQIIAAGKEGDFEVKDDGSVLIMDETLAPEEVQIVYRGTEGADMAAEGGVVVSLETILTDELILEGDMRDLVRHIQRLRKEKGYSVSDKVTIGIEKADAILAIFKAMIEQETNVTIGKAAGESHEVEIGEKGSTIFINSK